MTKYDQGMNMSSNYETKEQPIGSQAKYLGIQGNHEPAAGHLDTPSKHEGGAMSAAVRMVERHNERGMHAPTVCGHKMHDGTPHEEHAIGHGTRGE